MLKINQIQKSTQDQSVNFIFENDYMEIVESRIVIRKNIENDKKYIIFYLSSHDGCNKSCRFCHLTQTKQVSFHEVSLQEYQQQVKELFDYYQKYLKDESFDKIHFNFMARGEPLANSVILNHSQELFDKLSSIVENNFHDIYFNISSIFPLEIENLELSTVFKKSLKYHIHLYYSLYSLNEKFRKKWIPKSITVDNALKKLKDWQEISQEKVTFHWAFIQNENDHFQDIEDFNQKIKEYKRNLKIQEPEKLIKFNLVRYNPFSQQQGVESNELHLEKLFDLIKSEMPYQSKIVQRVGFDVKASCGMFIEK